MSIRGTRSTSVRKVHVILTQTKYQNGTSDHLVDLSSAKLPRYYLPI
jgi:hypothetical protein